jgi:hypothetical protein
MAHHHDHSHDDRNAYYLNQLFTIAVCGALGGVAVMLWWTDKIGLMLHPKFFPWVLMGGIALLTLVLIRAIAVWRSVDEAVAMPNHTHDHEHCDHDHSHCDHDHDHGIQSAAQTTGFSTAAAPLPLATPTHHHHDHDHEHGHDHDHGWAPWRYVVLLLPVVLYFLNLPNQGFSADAGGGDLSGLAINAPSAVRSTGQVSVSFVELQQASLTSENRDFYEGKNITLTGQYYGNSPKAFTLRRFKIACCGADAVKLDAVIMVDPSASNDVQVDPDRYRNQWVEVHGRVHFLQKPGTNEYITALMLYPTKEKSINDLVVKIPPPATPWVY